MPEERWDRGTIPTIRATSEDERHVNGWTCPFCGSDELLISYGDFPADRDRIELYCDNPGCDAREFIVLVTRGEGAHERADVTALEAIDAGTRAEQEAEGVEFSEDERGRVVARGAQWTPRDPSAVAARLIAHRNRRTEVIVEPIDGRP
jgi:hypothetical protein